MNQTRHRPAHLFAAQFDGFLAKPFPLPAFAQRQDYRTIRFASLHLAKLLDAKLEWHYRREQSA